MVRILFSIFKNVDILIQVLTSSCTYFSLNVENLTLKFRVIYFILKFCLLPLRVCKLAKRTFEAGHPPCLVRVYFLLIGLEFGIHQGGIARSKLETHDEFEMTGVDGEQPLDFVLIFGLMRALI
jgi:hypothetical protein